LTTTDSTSWSLADQVEDHPWLRALGGRRGLVDGAAAPIVFVAVNAVLGLTAQAVHALAWAVAASATTALGIVLVRVRRGEPLGGGLRGLVGLAVAIGFAAWTGQARDFFLPGIYVDGAYGVAFAASALLGRPIVGYVYASLFRLGRTWRSHRALRRTLAAATYGWALVFGTRTVVQAFLYRADQPELLALAKLLLGWPLTVLALLVTLAAARWARTRPGHCGLPDQGSR
jgi:hypothetical protein